MNYRYGYPGDLSRHYSFPRCLPFSNSLHIRIIIISNPSHCIEGNVIVGVLCLASDYYFHLSLNDVALSYSVSYRMYPSRRRCKFISLPLSILHS